MDQINQQHVEVLKDQMASYFYFGTTPDAYLDAIQSFFQEAFAEHIYNYVELVTEEDPSIKKELMSKCSQAFDENLQLCCDSVYNFIEQAIFRVPKHVELEEFRELSDTIAAFSEEEDTQMDDAIREMQNAISEKRAYINKLKEKLAEIKAFEKDMNEL